MSTIINQAKAIRAAYNKVNFTSSSAALLEIPTTAFDNWTVGAVYGAGQVVLHNGIKYLCMAAVTAQAHQPPDMSNGAMLAVYKPYRDAGDYDWLYGEYVLKGYRRQYKGVWYKVIQADAGANIYTPDLVPAVWSKVLA